MKKAVGIFITLIFIVAAAGVTYFFIVPMFSEETASDKFNSVYVQCVEDILNGFSFTSNRYSGVVETDELVKIDADSDKKIKKTFVKEGSVVKKGEKLFEYDVDEMYIQLEQDKLNIATYENSIKEYNTQIESLEKEKKTLSTNKQLTLTNRIEDLKLEVKKAELEKESLERNIKKLENSVKNSVVKSSVNGTIKSLDDPSTDSYITIASDGDYRIKAVVGELNLEEFAVGDKVLIRSRVDDSTWTGSITSIDTAKPITDSAAMNLDSVTKYPLYIAVDDIKGLLIGQHVTVESFSDEEEKKGIWLDEGYVVDADKEPYVWVEGDNKKIVKRNVKLGEYDESKGMYEIESGLTEEDFIAYAEKRITEGMDVVYTAPDTDEEVFTMVMEDGSAAS